jgi:hypothetical protein
VVEYYDVLGKRESAHIDVRNRLSIPIGEVERRAIVARTHAGPILSLTLSALAAESLNTFAKSNSTLVGYAIITVGELPLGRYEFRELLSAHRLLVFPLSSEQLVDVKRELEIERVWDPTASQQDVGESCLAAVGSDSELRRKCMLMYELDLREERHGGTVSANEIVEACLAAAGADATLRARCRMMFDPSTERQATGLDRAEELMKSENPDYDAVLRALEGQP